MISNRLSRWTLLFFACALGNFFIAQALILTGLTWPEHSVSNPLTLIAVHLLTIGWLLLLMLGALFQFTPVMTSRALPSQSLTLVTLFLIQIGLFSMICGFLGLELTWNGLTYFLPAGGVLVIAGVLIACYEIGTPLLLTRPLPLSGRMVLTGLAFLLLTVMLGLVMAMALSVPAFAVYVAPLVDDGVGYHVLAGLGGWFTLTAMGVSYKLLPMFMLAPEDRGPLGEATHQLGTAGFGIVIAAGLIEAWYATPVFRVFQDLGYAAIVASIAFYLWDIRRIYYTRKRVVIELHDKAAIGAFLLLGVSTALIGVLMVTGSLAAHVPELVFLVLFGWLSGLGLTQLYKIVPFLTWLGRFGQTLGRGTVPRVQDLVDEGRTYPWFGVYFTGVILATAAAFAARSYLFRLALALSSLATVGLTVEYWRAWQGRYTKRIPSTPPVPPFPTR